MLSLNRSIDENGVIKKGNAAIWNYFYGSVMCSIGAYLTYIGYTDNSGFRALEASLGPVLFLLGSVNTCPYGVGNMDGNLPPAEPKYWVNP